MNGARARMRPGVERLIDPGVIRLLIAIVESGGFGAAGASLGISQPSVSQQVRRIEREIGRPLFRRHSGGVALTADGEAVVIYARAMLGLAAELRDRLDRSGAEAEVAVGMSEDFCRTALPAVLRLFSIGHPHVRVRIVSGPYDTLIEAIEAEQVDFAIMRRHHRFADAEILFSDALVWVGGYGLPIPVPDPVPLVLPLAPSPSRGIVLDSLREAGRSYAIRFEGAGLAGVEMGIGADLGVCAGPRSMRILGAEPLPDGHGLPPLPTVEFVMVRGGGRQSGVGRAFAGVLSEAARSRFAVPEAACRSRPAMKGADR